jgi:hypothetical protein
VIYNPKTFYQQEITAGNQDTEKSRDARTNLKDVSRRIPVKPEVEFH